MWNMRQTEARSESVKTWICVLLVMSDLAMFFREDKAGRDSCIKIIMVSVSASLSTRSSPNGTISTLLN